MPRKRMPLPEDLPGSFSVKAARRAGVDADRLGRDDLKRRFHGARSRLASGQQHRSSLSPWENRSREIRSALDAYRPVMPAHAFVCGVTAAELWEMPVPLRFGADLRIGVFRPKTAPVRAGLVGHQFTRGFIRVIEFDGLAITDPASTWASMGGMLTQDELVHVADYLLRVPRFPGGFRPDTEPALAEREELEMLCRRKGRPGAPRLRRALELARDGASSPPETQIRLILADARFPEPALDHDVYDASGRFLGCSELAYPELKIAIEYESDGHLTRAQLERDIDKYQAYAEAGWATVRLTSEHVFREPREAVRRVRRTRAAQARLFLPNTV